MRASRRAGDAARASLTLDYLMIRGNEGGSAGGHAAIRFGDETFHFEHADGLLRLGRDDSERFQYVYRTLQNRDIELSRVPVTAETWALLHDAFERRVLVQERQLAIEDEIARATRRLLAALRDRRPRRACRRGRHRRARRGLLRGGAGSDGPADAERGRSSRRCARASRRCTGRAFSRGGATRSLASSRRSRPRSSPSTRSS